MEKKIVAVGNSITVGVGNGNKSFIDILGGGKYAVGGKASFQSEIQNSLTDALKTNPDYVVIFIGINNPMSGKGCSEGWEDSLIDDLKEMYAKVRDNGAVVIGITLLPAVKYWERKYNACLRAGTKYCCSDLELRNPSVLYDKVLKVNKFIKRNADIVIDSAKHLTDENGILPEYDKDGIHPNGKAQQWIADEIEKKIKNKGVKNIILISASLLIGLSAIGVLIYMLNKKN